MRDFQTDFHAVKAQINRSFGDVPFVRNNHISVSLFSQNEVWLRMEIQSKHLNHHGSLHGGYLLLLADSAAGMAALADGRNYVTQSQNFCFIRAVLGNVVTAKAKVLSRGGTVTVVHVEVRDEDDNLMGDGNFNMYALKKPVKREE